MKAFNIRYILAAATVLSFTSCVKEMDQVAKDPEDCMGVYFLEEQENAKTHTLEKGIDKTSLEIIVRRSNADKEEDINYKYSTYYLEKEEISESSYKEVPTSADDVFEFGELYFEEGQYETTIEVNFPNIKTGTKYNCTLYIDDPKYVSSVANNASSISFAVQMFEWKKVPGNGTWRDAIFSDMFGWDGRYLENNEVEVYERKDKKGFYRLSNVYSAEYFTRLVEGDEAGQDAALVASYSSYIDEKAYIYLDDKGDKIDVKLIGLDAKTNKLKLSHKALLPKPEGWVEPERKPRGDRPERRGGDRPERRGGDRRPRKE